MTPMHSRSGQAEITSAWPKYPDYRIDLLPCPMVARAWAGDVLVAETTKALRVEETDHQPILYFPLDDIRLDLMRATDHHTICPFKGQADYHSIDVAAFDGENVLWSYPDPFPEVAGLAGYGAFYHDRVRVELVEAWPGGNGDTVVTRFPTWGDVTDLVDVLDVRPVGAARYTGVTRPDRRRGVVEGSQLLAQAIVAAGKHAPDRRVVSAHMVFSRAADPDLPVEIELDPVSEGRTFSALAVRARQGSRECAPGVLLLDRGAPSIFTHQASPPSLPSWPDGPGPSGAVPYDMAVTGRDLRIVDGAYDPDPDAVGPPRIDAWLRYREVPDVDHLHAALLAQFTGHLAIGAALRPHPGVRRT